MVHDVKSQQVPTWKYFSYCNWDSGTNKKLDSTWTCHFFIGSPLVHLDEMCETSWVRKSDHTMVMKNILLIRWVFIRWVFITFSYLNIVGSQLRKSDRCCFTTCCESCMCQPPSSPSFQNFILITQTTETTTSPRA